MTDKTTTTTSDTSKPDYLIAHSVRESGQGKKDFFTRIGVAFPHKNGGGFTLHLDALPLDGKILVMAPKAGTDESAI